MNSRPPRRRGRSGFYYARSVVGQVWRHQSNQANRAVAVLRSVGWQLLKRTIRVPVLVGFGPYRIVCYPDCGSSSNVIYFTERFDPIEQAFLEHYLRPGDRVVDAGANVGLYSLWCAALVGRTGHVYAFEPVPLTAKRFRLNVRLNELDARITLYELALSDTPGFADFTVDRGVSNALVEADAEDTSRRRTTSVRSGRLDDVMGHGSPLAFAKIDVEGAEVDLLRGWDRHVSSGNPPVLLLEMVDGLLAHRGSSAAQLRSLLASRGYGLFDFDPEGSRLVPRSSLAAGNVFAVRLDRLDNVSERLRSTIELSP